MPGWLLKQRLQRQLQAGHHWSHQAASFLECLGRGLDVSRASLFEAFEDNTGALCVRQRNEWVAAGVRATIEVAEYQAAAPADMGLMDWAQRLIAGQPVVIEDTAALASAAERALMESQDNQACLAYPVFVQHRFWGFLAADEVRRARSWREPERRLMAQAARMLSRKIAQTPASH